MSRYSFFGLEALQGFKANGRIDKDNSEIDNLILLPTDLKKSVKMVDEIQ